MAVLSTVLADVRRQQPRCPQLVGIAQLLRFHACERDDPRTRLRRDHSSTAPTGQVRKRPVDPELKRLVEATLYLRSVRAEIPRDARDRAACSVCEQDTSALDCARGLRLRLSGARQSSRRVARQDQPRAPWLEGHASSWALWPHEDHTTSRRGIATTLWNQTSSSRGGGPARGTARPRRRSPSPGAG